MRMTRTTAIAVRCGLCAGLLGGAAWADERLPITDITLYRSGVGSFAHQGLIEGNADITLRFKSEQINDILKSLVLLDMGGGRIEAVRYSSKEPLEKRLASFAVNIADNPDLATLLSRLRGARVALETLDGRVAGVVLGIEYREKALGDQKTRAPFVNLVTDAGVRSVDLSSSSSMEILDEQLAQELNKALMALAEHRADTSKSVDLRFSGEGARRVVVAYVHEMPVWKTSYRLILPEDSASGMPTIQGWAIVENTTDEDWVDVTLSLVAGQPVSFTMDLYEPLFVPRPEVPVPVLAGLLPQVYEGGIAGVSAQDMARRSMRGRADWGAEEKDKAQAPAREQGARAMLGLSSEDMFQYAAQAQASAGQIGEVFQYTLDTPVTIERQQSAMLPILTSAIDGRRVSIYNSRHLADHPMRGVEITNSSGLQLMPGPVSVFDGSAYAGDAQIGHVSAGDKRLLSYAVDLDVDVQTEDKASSVINSIRIVRGSLVQEVARSVGTVYTMTNHDRARGRTVLVEHPKRPGWELVRPEKASETTDSLYRFEVELGAGQTRQLEVSLRRVEQQTMAIGSYSLDQLMVYQRQGRISEEVVEAIREAMALDARVKEAEERIQRLEQEREAIARDQSRIRQNMSGIDRTSRLYRRYVEKLDAQETRLEALEKELDTARTDLDLRRQAYREYLANLTVG